MHYGGRLEGPRPFLHPFPVETRWTNQITSFSLFLARCFSSLLTLLPLSLSLCLFFSFSCLLYLSLFLRLSSLRCFAVALTLSLSLSPSLSLSFLFSPHYPTHNRTPRERKTPAFAPHCSFGAYTRFQSAVCNLNIVYRKVCEKSYRDHSRRHCRRR